MKKLTSGYLQLEFDNKSTDIKMKINNVIATTVHLEKINSEDGIYFRASLFNFLVEEMEEYNYPTVIVKFEDFILDHTEKGVGGYDIVTRFELVDYLVSWNDIMT